MRLLPGDSIRETGDEVGIPESVWFDGPYRFHRTSVSQNPGAADTISGRPDCGCISSWDNNAQKLGSPDEALLTVNRHISISFLEAG